MAWFQRNPGAVLPVLGDVLLGLRRIWRDALTLLLALRDRRTPIRARLAALAALAYALIQVNLLARRAAAAGGGRRPIGADQPAPVLAEARARSVGVRRRLSWLLPVQGLGLPGWTLWRVATGSLSLNPAP